MMNLKQELDALIESTMAFANDVKQRQRIPDLPLALRAAEQALADTSKPMTTVWPVSAISKRIRKNWRGSARIIIRR